MSIDLTNENGVSPVVGVILMVAISVTLAAVVGTVVLNVGEPADSTAQAGIDITKSTVQEIDTTDDGSDNPDTTEYQVTVEVIDIRGADRLTIKASDTDTTQIDSESPDSTDNGGSDLINYDPSIGTTTLTSVGETSTVTQLTEGDRITIVGESGTTKNMIIQTYTVE